MQYQQGAVMRERNIVKVKPGAIFRTTYCILHTTYYVLHNICTTYSIDTTDCMVRVQSVCHLFTLLYSGRFSRMHFAQIISDSKVLFILFISLNFINNAPSDFGCDIAAHCIEGNSRWDILAKCKWGISSKSEFICKFFGILPIFACVYIQHTTYYYLAKLGCTACIVVYPATLVDACGNTCFNAQHIVVATILAILFTIFIFVVF